jgi:uncharacterized RDD family membrane protein YckC
MSSAVQREDTSGEFLATGTDGTSALRQVAAERLAAHRNRRAQVDAAARTRSQQEATNLESHADLRPAAERVRDAVAARYRESQSYREFLALEAQRAMERAQAEAEVAARSAQAVVAAQRQLLDEIAQWNQPPELGPLELVPARPSVKPEKVRASRAYQQREEQAEIAPLPPPTLHVRLHEELGPAMAASTYYAPAKTVAPEPEEIAELDEEIEFRRAPEFDNLTLETLPIPANILEFPRELVASRKVRPRLAEGPLMEETVAPPQLRIFEVEPELVAVEPEVAPEPDAPEWQSLRLNSGTAAQTPELAASNYFDHWLEPVIYAAPISQRLMCAALDTLLMVAGFGGAAAVAFKVAGGSGGSIHGAPLPLVAGAAAGTLLVFAAIYRLLFYTFNDATPGMRAMRIAFCTYDEDSPKRKAIRRRLFSTLLAACPLGLGLLWAVLDSDRLGWHDRMSRMYPRSY